MGRLHCGPIDDGARRGYPACSDIATLSVLACRVTFWKGVTLAEETRTGIQNVCNMSPSLLLLLLLLLPLIASLVLCRWRLPAACHTGYGKSAKTPWGFFLLFSSERVSARCFDLPAMSVERAVGNHQP